MIVRFSEVSSPETDKLEQMTEPTAVALAYLRLALEEVNRRIIVAENACSEQGLSRPPPSRVRMVTATCGKRKEPSRSVVFDR